MTENNRNVAEECAHLVDEHFKKNGFSPLVVPPFKAPADGLLAGLYNTAAKVPTNPSEKTQKNLPSLLLYDLENPQHQTTDAYKFIEKTRGTCSGLYGTSGAGKTRSIFEYLSHNYGLYFVASIENDPGSDDLPRILRSFLISSSPNRLSDADSQNTKPRDIRSELNYRVMDRYISMMIYVRTAIFDAINKHVKLTPYQWLLVQLFPKEALGVDLFSSVLQDCLHREEQNNNDDSWYDAMYSEYKQDKNTWPWTVVVVDEAQVLLNELKDYFLSQDGKRRRTAFSGVLRAVTNTVLHLGFEIGYPLVSGTGMSIEAINDTTCSTMAKNPHYCKTEIIFDRFKPLDAVAVREYLLTFLTVDLDAPGNEGEVPNESALRHVCEWLRGRPRWAASFLELYLVLSHQEHHAGTRGRFSPLQGGRLIQALDRYLDKYTTDGATVDRRGSYDPGTAFSGIKRVVDSNEWKNGVSLTSTLIGAIFKFAVGGQPSYIEKDYDTLIQVGVAALSHTDRKAVIDEPILVEAGLNFFGQEPSALNNLMSQKSTCLGGAFEKLLLPAIHKKFHDILEGQLGKKAAVLKDHQVSYRSSYGVLARKCSTPQDTMEWINDATSSAFEGQVPPFCLPDVHLGPDLIFLLWDTLYTTYVSVISQVKLRNDLNQMQALRTITPALLYYENRDSYKRKKKNGGREALSKVIASDESLTARWEAARPKLVGNEKGCVRFMVQYPCHKTQSATPGVLEDDKIKVLQEDEAGAPATKRRKLTRKLGWLVTIDKGTAEAFFGEKIVRYLNEAKDYEVPKEEPEDEEE